MADFGKRLKKLRKEKSLRQEDLAEILNLGQTTIANYEKNIRFPNQKTLNNIADYFEVSLDYLLGRSTKRLNSDLTKDSLEKKDLSNKNELAEKYYNFILNGEKQKAVELIHNEIKNQKNINEIYLKVFEPVMKKVGKAWEKGEISIDKEHYFSNITLELMAQLKNYFPETKNKKYKIIGATVPGEKHTIGLKILMDIFELNGWNTYYYGTNIPNSSITNAVNEINADILALSATLPSNLNTLNNTIKIIKNNIPNKKLKIIVGGNAFKNNKNQWKKIGADGYVKNINQAVKLAEKLIN